MMNCLQVASSRWGLKEETQTVTEWFGCDLLIDFVHIRGLIFNCGMPIFICLARYVTKIEFVWQLNR